MFGRWPKIAVGALVIAALGAPGVAAASDPFHGTWSAIDVDGSRMTSSFSGSGGSRTYTFTDLRATSCGGGPYDAVASGDVTGGAIHVVGLGGCRAAGLGDPFEATYDHDPGNSTLSDGLLTWRRGNQGEAFLGVWKATDTDGSAMTLSFGGTGLTRDVSFFDSLATACEPDASFSGTGTGTIGAVPGDGRFIRVAASGSCDGSSQMFSGDDKYEYDYLTNTLIGPLEPLEIGGNARPWTVVWHR